MMRINAEVPYMQRFVAKVRKAVNGFRNFAKTVLECGISCDCKVAAETQVPHAPVCEQFFCDSLVAPGNMRLEPE
jgi:hypothetical protein